MQLLFSLKVGDPDRCTYVSNVLQEKHNIYIQAINYPTVARGSERLRIAPTPWHTKGHVSELLGALDTVWKEAGLPKVHPVCTNDCNCQVDCNRKVHGFNRNMVTVKAWDIEMTSEGFSVMISTYLIPADHLSIPFDCISIEYSSKFYCLCRIFLFFKIFIEAHSFFQC